jgi:HlyD family secretion protein
MNMDTLERTKQHCATTKDRILSSFASASTKVRISIVTVVVVGLLALVVLGGQAFVAALRPAQDANAKASITVAVDPASYRQMERKLGITGTVWAWDPLSIGAEVGGLRIDTVNVEEGAFVKKGQVLATLNSSILRAQLDRELAKLKHSKANLGKTIQPNRRQDISALQFAVEQTKAQVAEADAYLERAKANLDNARNNSGRYAALHKEGAVSAEEAEAKSTLQRTSEAELLHAQNEVAAAKFVNKQAIERLSQAVEGGRLEDIQMSQATVAETQANVKALQAQVAQTIIRAPSDGWITKRDAHIGDISVANESLFNMVRDNRLEIRAQVPEKDLAKLSPGQSVEVTGVLKDKLVGKIREISPLVDVDTRLGMIRIDIPFDKDIHPGIFVHGQVSLGTQEVMTVPSSAVVDRHEHSCVFLVEGNKVYSRSVNCGERFGDFVEVSCGIKPGELVVVSGAGFLKDGDVVRVADKRK